MPIVWRVLFWIEKFNQSRGLDIGLLEFNYMYDLDSFGYSRFLLRLKPHQSPFVLKMKHNNGSWKEKYFFLRRDSIPGGIPYRRPRLKSIGLTILYTKDPGIHLSSYCLLFLQLLGSNNLFLLPRILKKR